MAVDRAWLEENLGGPAPTGPAGALGAEALVATPEPTPKELALERIEFDGGAPEVARALATRPAAPPTLSHYTPVGWPDGLAPEPAPRRPRGPRSPRPTS